MNPDDKVCLWTDDSQLMPEYRSAWDNYAKTPQAKSDLLRYSVLERWGGWYFDVDAHLRKPASQILRYISGTRFACAQLHFSRMLNPDVLYCPLNWTGWWAFHEYIENYKPRTEGRFEVLAFAYRLLLRMRIVLGDKVEVMDNPRLFPDRPRYLTDDALMLRRRLDRYALGFDYGKSSRRSRKNAHRRRGPG
jgi:hypothetical protein